MNNPDCVYCEHRDKAMFSDKCGECTDFQNFERRPSNEELSRLRDLVREMRDSLDDVTRMLEVAFMTDYEPQQGSVGGIAKALIAKADAALKESGHE